MVLSLAPGSCVFVTCSMKFSANFILQVTNVQGQEQGYMVLVS